MFKKNIILLFIRIILLSFIFASCGKNNKSSRNADTSFLHEPLINANKMYVEKESNEINEFIKKHQLEMNTSGTGLRYLIYKKANASSSSPLAIQGKLARVNYSISLLNGTKCYSSDSTGAREFLIGKDQVESGLHEGIQLMKVGEKALFILPSHLAHGLVGDGNKIPPRSTVIYEIELLSLK